MRGYILLLDLLDDSSGPAEPIEEDDESGDIEDHVPAPSLLVARQQLKGLATFMADNPRGYQLGPVHSKG